MAAFYDDLCGPGFPVSLEITPPKSSNPAILVRRASLLGDYSQTVNVIQRPDRQSSLDASIELLDAGYEPVWHLAVRGRSMEDIVIDAGRGYDAGIRHVLCVLGDHGIEGGPASPTIAAVVRELRDRFPGLAIGATLNQFVPGPKTLANLVGKLNAGARYVQTQPVFDPHTLVALAEQVKDAQPEACIVPMVMPLSALADAKQLELRLGIGLPERLLGYLEHEDATSAWQLFAENVAVLRDSPLFAGTAVMTFGMDPTREIGDQIRAALG